MFSWPGTAGGGGGGTGKEAVGGAEGWAVYGVLVGPMGGIGGPLGRLSGDGQLNENGPEGAGLL